MVDMFCRTLSAKAPKLKQHFRVSGRSRALDGAFSKPAEPSKSFDAVRGSKGHGLRTRGLYQFCSFRIEPLKHRYPWSSGPKPTRQVSKLISPKPPHFQNQHQSRSHISRALGPNRPRKTGSPKIVRLMAIGGKSAAFGSHLEY